MFAETVHRPTGLAKERLLDGTGPYAEVRGAREYQRKPEIGVGCEDQTEMKLSIMKVGRPMSPQERATNRPPGVILLESVTTVNENRTRPACRPVAALLALLAVAASANAATWYVDNAATGAENGTSWANAWTSPMSVSGVSAGDTVYISGGSVSKTYTDVSSWHPPGGFGTNHATYRVGQVSGHNGTVIFEGSGKSICLNGSMQSVTIDGSVGTNRNWTMQHYGTVVMGDGSADLTLRYLNLDTQIRLAYGVRRYEIDHCYLDCVMNVVHAIDLSLPDGADTWGENKIHHNTILVYQSNRYDGIGDDGIIWGWSLDIYNNSILGKVASCAPPVHEHGDGVQSKNSCWMRIFNNTFANMANSSIGWFPDSGCSHVWIYNNLCYITASGIAGHGIDWNGQASGVVQNDCVIANNTFVGIAAQALRMNMASGSETFNNSYCVNNLLYNCGGTEIDPQVSAAANVATSSARFLNPGTNDYHLAASDTTARDKGSSVLASYFGIDHDGVPRPYGPAWDIGAFEYVGSGPATNPVIQVSPSSLSFGSIAVGTTQDLTLAVKNVGGGILAGMAAVSAPFSITGGGTYSLGSNQSQTVTVRYSPTAAGGGSQVVTLTGGGGATAAVTGLAWALLPGLSFESYAGTVTSPFVTNGGYVSQSVETGVADGGRAIYGFRITNSENYVVSANVKAPDTSANSIFVSIDADPVDPTMIWDMLTTTGFAAKTVSWRGNGTDVNNQYVPAVFSLSAGTHQLIIVGRESGVQLGRITISPYEAGAPAPPRNLRIFAGP
jgi:hypothetical protein